MTSRIVSVTALCVLTTVLAAPGAARAADWPMYGRDATRNPVSPERNPPTDWQVERRADDGRVEAPARNVRWTAALGNATFGSPVVAGGLVWACATNERPRDPAFTKDAGVLACFDEATGRFLWQRASSRLGVRDMDWPGGSHPSPPLVDGDRLYYVTNRWEVVCLDVGPLVRRTGEPREVWTLDLRRDLGVSPFSPVMGPSLRCAVGASHHGRVYVITGNAPTFQQKEVPAPNAPSLICLEQATGKVLWQDRSPGRNIFGGQWSSPALAVVGGRAQVIAPQGDGWVRAFDALTGEPLWQFDVNPKASAYPQSRNPVIGPPVVYDGRVYVTTGQDPEHGTGHGVVWCVDPTRRGDVSEELDDGPADVGPAGGRPPAPGGPRKGRPNPNTAVVWKFDRRPGPDGKTREPDRMHRTMAGVAAADGLVVAVDFSGYVHCLDARTGQKYWTHDADSDLWAAPLVCDGKVYVGTGDGDVRILALGRHEQLLARREVGEWIAAAPVLANGTLYVLTRGTLYAIREAPAGTTIPAAVPASRPAAAAEETDWPQWRGPGRTNVAADAGLLGEWPPDGPPLLWRAKGLGEGVPSVAVAAGRVYTLGYRGGAEFLTAWEAATGAKAWAARVGPAVAEMRQMRWLSQRTPTVDADRVYVATARGELICLATADGREHWRKDYAADFGGRPGAWGFCDYPVVDGDRLICTPGGEAASMVALDKRTGAVLWKRAVPGAPRASYNAPVLAELAGVRQVVHHFDTGAAGVDPEDGRLLWHSPETRLASGYGNVHTVIAAGPDAVFCSAGWGAGHALVAVARDGDAFAATVRYRHPDRGGRAFNSWLGNSSLVGGHVYTNAGACIELASGKVAWRENLLGGGRVTAVVADGRVCYRLTDGTVVLAEANPDRYVERGRFLPPRAQAAEPAWSSPVIAGGRLYLRDQDELLCYDVRRDRSAAFAAPGDPPPPTGPASAAAAAATRPAPAGGGPATRRVGHDAIFVPTPQDVTDRLLELAAVRKDDVVYDLGCGDGRIVVTAARRYGCRAVGVDLDPECVRLSRASAAKHRIQDLVTIERKDLFTVDLGADATVVALYVGRDVNRRLVPQLTKLRPGARVVSHNFDIDGYEPDRVVDVVSGETDTRHTLYLYTAPLRKTP